MRSTASRAIAFGLAVLFVLVWILHTKRTAAAAQTSKSYHIVRLYTGPDGLTHSEDIEAPAGPNGVVQLMPVTGAEVHRSAPGTVVNWHTEARRQYVITLSGHGELEIGEGKKIAVGPGDIELIQEEATGKGHITRVIGAE